MKNIVLLFTAALFAITTSCEETKRVLDVAGDVQLSGTYTVTQINSKASTALNADEQTLSFAALDRSIRGNTGCNTFFGNYTIDLYAITIGELAVTKKACPASVMTQENNLLSALNNTGSYSLQDDTLTLLSKTDRSVLLTAKKQKTE